MKSNLNSLIAKADHCLSKGRTEDAVKTYMSVLKLLPTHPVVNTRLGMLLFLAGDTAKAITHFERALKFDSNETAHWANLILAYDRLDEIDVVQRLLDQSSIHLGNLKFSALLQDLATVPYIKSHINQD